jgi:hypothetical protein
MGGAGAAGGNTASAVQSVCRWSQAVSRVFALHQDPSLYRAGEGANAGKAAMENFPFSLLKGVGKLARIRAPFVGP